MLDLSGIISDSIVDGPGIRTTVFSQGCPHHCKGCHNEHTWEFEGGYMSSVERILEEAAKDKLLRGITVRDSWYRKLMRIDDPKTYAKGLMRILVESGTVRYAGKDGYCLPETKEEK